MTILDRRNDAYATQPMTPIDDAYTVPVRPSGPLTPSASQSGIHRVYVTDAGTPKRITRPRPGLLPELEQANDPLAGQPHACPPPVLTFIGERAAREARRRLSRWQEHGRKLHMSCTVINADGRSATVTFAGRGGIGCYFTDGAECWVGDFNPLWDRALRNWPELRTAVWGFDAWANLDEACWAKVEAAYNQWRRKGA